jgi:hypothetical protein
MQTPHEFFQSAMRPQRYEIPFSRAEQYADFLLHELAAATSGTEIAADPLYKEIFERLYQLRTHLERPDLFGGVTSAFLPRQLRDIFEGFDELGNLANNEHQPALQHLVSVFRDAANHFVAFGIIQYPTIGDYL